VLLAAVVKARGLPARVCHGLVYVEQGGSAISGREADAQAAGEDEADETLGASVRASVGADGSAAASPAVTGQFGWHMWSQAMVNGCVTPWDPTSPRGTPPHPVAPHRTPWHPTSPRGTPPCVCLGVAVRSECVRG